MFVCLFMLWTGVGPITEYSCDKPVPVFLSAMAKKQTPPIDRPWCYHTGAVIRGTMFKHLAGYREIVYALIPSIQGLGI